MEENKEIKIIEATKLYAMLYLIKKNPHIWLTTKSISSLQNFLNGYLKFELAQSIYNSGEPNIEEFDFWLCKRFKRYISKSNIYTDIFLKECEGNEELAFDAFFGNLDRFLNEKKLV